MKKVCVVTAARAEYGLLKPVMRRIDDDPELELQLVVTGTHLEEKHGETVSEIIHDGFTADFMIPIISKDDEAGILDTMAKAVKYIGRAFIKLRPDIIAVLGDRYELVSIVSAAVVLGIPVAHISGGEISQGANDEQIRHAVTKMSHLHFTETEEFRRRVIRMGEDPGKVFNVGSLGVENIKTLPLLKKSDLESNLGLNLDKDTLLVTYHPVTTEDDVKQTQLRALLDAFDACPGFNIIFTCPNADKGRNAIDAMIGRYAVDHPERCKVFASLGTCNYLSLMKYCTGVVGNSSSGIIEAPSIPAGVVNVGNRQKGRLHSQAVIDCPSEREALISAISMLKDPEYRKLVTACPNPYYSEGTSKKIVDILKRNLTEGVSTVKKFYDL